MRYSGIHSEPQGEGMLFNLVDVSDFYRWQSNFLAFFKYVYRNGNRAILEFGDGTLGLSVISLFPNGSLLSTHLPCRRSNRLLSPIFML